MTGLLATGLGAVAAALVAAVGRRRSTSRLVLRRLAIPVRHRRPRLPRPLAVAAAVAGVATVRPTAALLLALVAIALPRVRERTRRRRRGDDIARAVPDVADLFLVAATGGLTVPLAVRAVAERAPPGPLSHELRRAAVEADAGRLVSDALLALVERTSEEVRPLVATLVSSDRYGTPLVSGLERAADDARRRRQRRAEERARRVPVLLLLPLITCVLPAFALLTVAPLIANGLDAVRL